MNTNNIIYHRSMSLKNFNNSDNADTNLYVLPSLLSNDKWNKYRNYPLATYYGIKNYLLEFAFITNLAYTYFYTKEEVYEISPYYIESMYKKLDMKLINEVRRERKTHSIYKTSKVISDYITILNVGGMESYDEQREKYFSKYSVKDNLKLLSHEFNSSDGNILKIDIKFLLDKSGFVERDKKYAYECDGLFFNNISRVKYYSRNHNYAPYKKNTYVDIALKKCGDFSCIKFQEFDNELHSDKNELKYPVSLHSSFSVNRKNIKSLLCNSEALKKYKNNVIRELVKIYNNTSDDKPSYDIYYRQTNEGRHYAQNSSIQNFPKELRKLVLSDYSEVDIKCAIFSIYKNLAELYGYKGSMKYINSMVENPKEFRYRFTSDSLKYDDVKSVLTAIAYGANANVYDMYSQYINSDYCYRKSSLLTITEHPKDVIDMVNTTEISGLVSELHKLGKFLISKSKKNDNIVNIFGNVLNCNRKTSYGKKLAHIYQAWESRIMTTLSNMSINDKEKLCDGHIALYLHDGIYVDKSIAKKIDFSNICSNLIYKELGIEISYDV